MNKLNHILWEDINIYNETSARVIGSDATRTEIKSYPDPSLREAVVNAFCHFDAEHAAQPKHMGYRMNMPSHPSIWANISHMPV